MSTSSEAKVVKANTLVKTGKMSNAVQKPSFETIPTEVRLEIYRELLLLIEEDFVDPAMSGNDMGDDSTSDDSGKKLHVAILRCNKKIHREANGVLYGENTFHFQLTAERKVKLWHQHFLEESPTRVSRRCSRLITKVHLSIDPLGHEFGFHGIVCATGTMRINLNHVVSKLALNDLKLLDIHFINRPGFDHPFSAFLQQRGINIENEFGPLYYGEECLEPLLKLRATTFVLECTSVSPGMAAKLKATIEGPKDTAFLAVRRQMEDEEESELEDYRTDVEDEEEGELEDYNSDVEDEEESELEDFNSDRRTRA